VLAGMHFLQYSCQGDIDAATFVGVGILAVVGCSNGGGLNTSTCTWFFKIYKNKT